MIFINTSFELKRKVGIGAYILTLIEALKEQKQEYKCVELTIPAWIKYKWFFQMIWLNTVIFLLTLIKKPKLFISPSFIMPYFKVKGTKYVTVIHDLCSARVGEMKKYHQYIYETSINIAIKKADIIVTVSETIKNELIEKYNINPNRIIVVYNSIGKHLIHVEVKQDILNKYGLQKDKYILSVATLNKRKNIPELIKAFESISDKYPELKLVLVGGLGNENREKLSKHPKIIFTGYISDEEIPTLYKNALLYVYPSLYEGFGIPLIEAQYCSCPVLCSDIPVFREIGLNSAEYCKPSAKDIADKIEYLIDNTQKCAELVREGNENVKRFSIKKISEQLDNIVY